MMPTLCGRFDTIRSYIRLNTLSDFVHFTAGNIDIVSMNILKNQLLEFRLGLFDLLIDLFKRLLRFVDDGLVRRVLAARLSLSTRLSIW